MTKNALIKWTGMINNIELPTQSTLSSLLTGSKYGLDLHKTCFAHRFRTKE
jgi:hypothetical protein